MSLNSLKALAFASLIFLAPVIGAFNAILPHSCNKAFIFFDLGDTLIDTHTHDYNPMFAMPGALAHLRELNSLGYPLGIISDVPESWGRDQLDVAKIKDYPTAKFKRLLNFIDGVYSGDRSSWLGPKFEWSLFGIFENREKTEGDSSLKFFGRVILPFKTSERKKNGSVIMYQRARLLAAQSSCQAIYETSDQNELNPAKKAGLITYLVGEKSDGEFYLPIAKIGTLLKAPIR